MGSVKAQIGVVQSPGMVYDKIYMLKSNYFRASFVSSPDQIEEMYFTEERINEGTSSLYLGKAHKIQRRSVKIPRSPGDIGG